jgi:hypothetical protein
MADMISLEKQKTYAINGNLTLTPEQEDKFLYKKIEKTITLTFGDAGENHAGMEMIGKIGEIGSGFSKIDLMGIKTKMEENGYDCEYTKLNDLYNFADEDKVQDAYILVIRGGINYFIEKEAGQMMEEMNSFEWDDKYFDTRRQRVLNKHARTNVCFGDISIEPDYENKKGRIVGYDSVPLLKLIKEKLPNIVGEKGENLVCEGNNYKDINKCGIGWHGDSERKKVIGFRLGATMVLKFKWYKNSKSLGNSLTIQLNDGDMYVMSEKATGYDWKYRSKFTLRHCAGCEKYTKELK